jgi:hypothetical protein
MISIEALSAFIALAIIILFMVIFHVELSNTTSIDKICSLLISTALAIFLAVLYFIEVRDNYLNDLLENNNKILASETTCNIDYIKTFLKDSFIVNLVLCAYY